MRIALTAFLSLFGIAANAADLAPYTCCAEEAHAVDGNGNLLEAVNGVAYEAFAYDDTGCLSEAVTEVGANVFANAWHRGSSDRCAHRF